MSSLCSKFKIGFRIIFWPLEAEYQMERNKTERNAFRSAWNMKRPLWNAERDPRSFGIRRSVFILFSNSRPGPFSKFRSVFSRIWKKLSFFGNYFSKKLSPPRKNFKIHSCFSKLAHTNTNNKLKHFLKFRT